MSIGVFLSVLEALQELADLELLVSHPDTPKALRSPAPPTLDQDF